MIRFLLRALSATSLAIAIGAFSYTLFFAAPEAAPSLADLSMPCRLAIISIVGALVLHSLRVWLDVAQFNNQMHEQQRRGTDAVFALGLDIQTLLGEVRGGIMSRDEVVREALRAVGATSVMYRNAGDLELPGYQEHLEAAWMDFARVRDGLKAGVVNQGVHQSFESFIQTMYKHVSDSLVCTSIWPSQWWCKRDGIRYMEFNKELLDRGVKITRYFLFPKGDTMQDIDSYLEVMKEQADAGIDVRVAMLDLSEPADLEVYFDVGLIDDGRGCLVADPHALRGPARSRCFWQTNSEHSAAGDQVEFVRGVLARCRQLEVRSPLEDPGTGSESQTV